MSGTEREWQQLYVEALLETNPLNLAGRVATAEKAIFLRRKELRIGLIEQAEQHANRGCYEQFVGSQERVQVSAWNPGGNKTARSQVTRSSLGFLVR
jgi:hypothetical protein